MLLTSSLALINNIKFPTHSCSSYWSSREGHEAIAEKLPADEYVSETGVLSRVSGIKAMRLFHFAVPIPEDLRNNTHDLLNRVFCIICKHR